MKPAHHEVEFRPTATDTPVRPVSIPYELRTEMTWLDFCHPMNPLGTPRDMIQAMHTALVDGELSFAPDVAGYALRDAIAASLQVSKDCVVAGTSATHLIRAAAQVFPHAKVGVATPCPIEYEQAIENAGHEFVRLNNPRSFATVDTYSAHAQVGNFDAAVLANPSYPASRLLSSSVLVHYLETCKWVIVDESYIELSFGGESVLPLLAEYPHLIVIRNPSVTYCMPGLPLAFALAQPETARRMRTTMDATDLTLFTEVLARHVVTHQDYIEETHEFLDKEIPWMQCMLSLIPGISIYPAEGNFVLCEFSAGEMLRLGVTCAEELVIRLQLAGFFVRYLKGTPGIDSDNFFCVAVRQREENQRLLEAMRSILNS